MLKLYNYEFITLTMVATEMGKGRYFSYHSQSCKEEKILYLRDESYTF